MFKPRDKVLIEADYEERQYEAAMEDGTMWRYRSGGEDWINGTVVAKATGPYYSVRIEIEGVRYHTSVLHEKYLRKASLTMRCLYV